MRKKGKYCSNKKVDIYEAAILLDGYLETQKKQVSQSHIIRRTSTNLRQMAKKGIAVDEAFRNEGRIAFQMKIMELA